MHRNITRTRLLFAVAAGAAAQIFSWTPVRAAQFVYKFGHPSPLDVPMHTRAVQMADAVKTETNGRLEIQIYPNFQLGNEASMLTQLRLGSNT